MRDREQTEQSVAQWVAACRDSGPTLFNTLSELVTALDTTPWSIWQSTYRFDPALEKARYLLNRIVSP